MISKHLVASLLFLAGTALAQDDPGPVPRAVESWINTGSPQRSMIQSIGVRFDRNVAGRVKVDSLKIRDIATGTPVELDGVSLYYDPRNNSASWQIARETGALLADGNYIAWLETDSLLDERVRAASAVAGTPIDDFTFGFHQFTGDSDGDRDVDFRDASVLRETWQRDISQPFYHSFFDFDLSDLVDELDRQRVEPTYFTLLPPAPALHLFLRNDTGESASDNATGLYATGLQSIGTGSVAAWRARLGNQSPADITARVSNGAAVLDQALIDQLNGSPLAPGTYTLTVEALDAAGTVIAADALTFEFLGAVLYRPHFITTPPPGVALGQVGAAEPLNLSNWTVQRWPGSQGASNWVVAPDGLSVEQTRNSAPAALVSDQSFLNLRVTGRFRVDTTGDDDFMGFIFGYQNDKQFYIFDWKQGRQGSLGGIAERGMSIKRFDAGDRELSEADFWWSNASRENMTVLVQPNDIPWVDFQDYDITLDFTPGRIVVEVFREGTLLDRLEATDDTFTGGRFGFYNYSQDSVIYNGFTQQALNNIYFYDAEATDPDGGTVTYSLAPNADGSLAPDGAFVNPDNGSLVWEPSVDGVFPFTLVATDPDGLTDTQRFDVLVSPVDLPPVVNIVKTAPSLFPGDPVVIRVVATDDQQIFRTRLFLDDLEVELDSAGSFTTSFSELGVVELRAIAIDSAEQVSTVTSYIRVLDPTVPPAENPNQSPVAPPGQTTGVTTDLRPLVSIEAPRSTADDPTRFVGTVNPNGGTLERWLLEWAPSSTVDAANLAAGGVLWQKIAEGTTGLASAPLATITPANFPNEVVFFRLRAQNTSGLGNITAVAFNPRSTPNTTTPPQNTGGGAGPRPTAVFTAPLGPADDSTRIRGSVGANGGTLQGWVLDYAPRSAVDLTNLTDPAVSWTLVERGSTAVTDSLLATLVPASLPDAVLVFRLTALNQSGLGTVAAIAFNPSAAGFTVPGTTPTGSNPATAARPVTRITSPGKPGDDLTLLVGSVLANGGTLERWQVDYAPLGAVNAADLTDPAVAWTPLASGTDEIDAETIAPLNEAAFLNGKWVIRLRAFNSNGLGSLASTTLDSGDQSIPSVAFTSPAADADITFLTDVVGTVSPGSGVLDSWTLEVAPTEQVGLNNLNVAADWVEIGRGSSAVSEGMLGTLDPTLLRNGSYILRLRAFNTSGRGIADGRLVYVSGEAKLGNFRMEFTDLDLPVSGLPIHVRRIYDSLDTSHKGDFGPGWTLSLNEANITETVPDTGADFFNATPFKVGTRVFLTNPAGQRIGFTFNVRDRRNSFIYTSYAPYFVPDPGVRETLTIAPSNFERVELDADGSVYTIGLPFGYNPDRYVLTTLEGTSYDYDQRSGLREIRDANGNKLTFARTGITHSDGTHVAITRNSAGNITRITDPAGKATIYDYDSRGRLRFVTDRVGGKTEFVYASIRRPNFLTEIIDPRGVSAVRSEYDDDGRLIRQIDPKGKAVEFAYDPVGMSQSTTDRLGFTTTQEFDRLGNVVRNVDKEGGVTLFDYYTGTTRARFVTDPSGKVVSRAYDARGNLTVETDAAAIGEDPAAPATGSTTRFQFNADNDPTEVTDARGNVNRISYDPASGELLSLTAAANDGGDVTSLGYHANGEVRSVTDPAGNVTTYTYLRRGNPGFDDAGLAATTLITDSEMRSSGGVLLRKLRLYQDVRRLTLRRVNFRTLPDATEQAIAVDYTYDDEGQVVLGKQPDGRIEESRYDAVGQLAATLIWRNQADFDSGNDSLSRATLYTRDVSGNVIATRLPDMSTVSSEYDAENRKISDTDALGRVTRYEYDGEDRLRFTYFPDDTPGDDSDNPRTEFVYDAAGRQTDFYDELRHRTETRYDARGFESARIQHLEGGATLVTTYEYDADGNLTFLTSPEGMRVETVYDSRSRPVTTLFPATAQNGVTRTSTAFDALGRRTREIDQEGRGKQFTYDGLGRMIRVEYLDSTGTPLAGERVEYEYDEVGNRTAQTDARGNRTTFQYDVMGRRTARTLPGGATETFEYDGFGNLAVHTDFTGYATRHFHDALGRVTETLADPTHPSLDFDHAPARIATSYRADGSVATKALFNKAGSPIHSESYTYDARGRMTRKQTSAGRLDYSYLANGLLASTASDAVGGVDLVYSYDRANRLTAATDAGSGTTAYAYDDDGNLISTTYGNGVTHVYQYDTLNRLLNLRIANGSDQTLDSYAYTLRPRGDRAREVRADGRTRDFEFDEFYRLSAETISGGPASAAGQVRYTFDASGNRLSRTSSVAGLAAQSLSYNADNLLVGTLYDDNGNTRTSPLTLAPFQGTDSYDFRNRLIRRARTDGTVIDLRYDGDGIRIGKSVTSGGTTVATGFLVDTNSLTGYAQVVEERSPAGDLKTAYIIGSDLICQRSGPSAVEHFFAYDGGGSVVALLDSAGAIAETYVYDAFGNLLGPQAGLMTQVLYRGETFDPDLGMYYLRARYAQPDTGRFWTADGFEGFADEPISLHRYLYANANPVTGTDPSGNFTLISINVSFSISINLRNVQAQYLSQATRIIADKLLKVSAMFARQYLDFRGFARIDVRPVSNLVFYRPFNRDRNLGPEEFLGVDILYSQSLSFFHAAVAARLISAIAGTFSIVKTDFKTKLSLAAKLAVKVAKWAIKNTVGKAATAVSDAYNRLALVRLVAAAKTVSEAMEAFKSAAANVSEYSPLAIMATDYYLLTDSLYVTAYGR
jgi:RHS repeat-associated protein